MAWGQIIITFDGKGGEGGVGGSTTHFVYAHSPVHRLARTPGKTEFVCYGVPISDLRLKLSVLVVSWRLVIVVEQ